MDLTRFVVEAMCIVVTLKFREVPRWTPTHRLQHGFGVSALGREVKITSVEDEIEYVVTVFPEVASRAVVYQRL